jgi:hypothetical protein
MTWKRKEGHEKKKNVLEGVGTTRPANISICINMPIIIKCVRWQGKSEGTSIHEAKIPCYRGP